MQIYVHQSITVIPLTMQFLTTRKCFFQMIWDPMSQISPSVNLICPLCFADINRNVLLKPTGEWTEFQHNSMRPRLIWDSGWFCVIVGCIYKCLNINHRIISYHAGVLKQLPIFEMPFVLTHGICSMELSSLTK